MTKHGLLSVCRTLACVSLLLGPLGAAQNTSAPVPLAPYYPTPMAVVDEMLELGELRPGELLYDLGSGDGRVVIRAAQQVGARAVGFEIDPRAVKHSRARIEKAKLSHLASIELQDLIDADFSKPDLIFIYLLPDSNDKIQPLIERQARPGTRVISHDFPFTDWEAEKVVEIEDTSEYEPRTHKLYLYRR